MSKIFVYGTLKRGFGNNVLLRDSEFLCEGKLSKEYSMYVGGIPYVVHEKGKGVVGELWEVDDNALFYVDALEGHPNWYKRTPVIVKTDKGDIDAETYLMTLSDADKARMETMVEY